MSKGKRILKFISSMRFAIILLGILAALCCAGSFVTQRQSYAWYSSRYSERAAAFILAFRLDDVFHSWYFILISSFLCLNLLMCNVVRLPALIKRTKSEGSLRGRIGCWGAWVCHIGVLLLLLGYSLGQMTYKEESNEGKGECY